MINPGDFIHYATAPHAWDSSVSGGTFLILAVKNGVLYFFDFAGRLNFHHIRYVGMSNAVKIIPAEEICL